MFKLVTDVIAALAVIAIIGMMWFAIIVGWYYEIKEIRAYRAATKKNKKERK